MIDELYAGGAVAWIEHKMLEVLDEAEDPIERKTPMKYENNTGATGFVTSQKYPALNMRVHPGESIVLDAAMEAQIPDELTAVTP